MRFFRRAAQPPRSQPIVPIVQITPPQPKTLSDLEREMALEAQVISTQVKAAPLSGIQLGVQQTLQRGLKRLVWIGLLLGLPVGALALINLPYSPIRRPIAQTAPILLMPSYVSLDHNFRQASANLEVAKQLIDRATAPTDLELGEQRLNQAQANLDQLPSWAWSELPDTEGWWWYSWRFSRLGLNQARAEVGRLQGKLFQEKNAQSAFNQAEQVLKTSMQQYQQAKTPLEQQIGLKAWQAGLDQIRQVPEQTLAGAMARDRIATAQRDFEAIGGLISSNQESLNLISAAKQFSWQAAQASQHPPHTVTEWQQVLDLRQQAIQRLERVSPQDAAGYAEAQRLLAEYQRQQGQIKVRQDAEAKAVANFKQAQAQINDLIATTPRQASAVNRSGLASRLQQIMLQLQTIDSGTTVYPEAQRLLVLAQQKLKDWQIK
ncbi:MAG: hypothetical protein ACKO7W_18670 [Elainella sp.]